MMAANVQGDDSIYSSKSWFVFQSVRLAEKRKQQAERNLIEITLQVGGITSS